MGARSPAARREILPEGQLPVQLPKQQPCSFFVLSKPQAWYGITRQRVCNREAYVITEGGCNRVAHIFSLRLDDIHGYAELHARLRRITSTLRVIGTRCQLAHVSREQKIFEIVEIPIFLKLTPPRRPSVASAVCFIHSASSKSFSSSAS